MAYEPQYERVAVLGPDRRERPIVFLKAGRLAVGEQPEVYFFGVDGKPVGVGVSGAASAWWQRSRRYLSREEEIDVAGLRLKQQIEAGGPVEAKRPFIQEPELDELVRALGLQP